MLKLSFYPLKFSGGPPLMLLVEVFTEKRL